MLQAALISLMILVAPSGSQFYAVDPGDTSLHSAMTSGDDCIKTANDLNVPVVAEPIQKSGDHIYICLPINTPADTPKNATP